METAATINWIIEYFFSSFSGTIINGLILLLLLIGLIKTFIARLQWRAESVRLTLLKQDIEKTPKSKAVELQKIRSVSQLPERSLIKKLITSIVRIQTLGGDSRAFHKAADLVYPVKSSWNQVLLGSMIILGLIGTIFGMSQAIMTLKAVLDNTVDSFSQIQDLQETLEKMLHGLGFMKNAFSTTMCGFSSFILFSIIDRHHERSVSQIIHDIQVFTVDTLIPFITPEKPELSLDKITGKLETISNHMKSVGIGLSEIPDRIEKKLSGFSEVVHDYDDTFKKILQMYYSVNTHYDRLFEMSQKFVDISGKVNADREEEKKYIIHLFEKIMAEQSAISQLYQRLDINNSRLEKSFSTGLNKMDASVQQANDMTIQLVTSSQKHAETLLKKINPIFDDFAVKQKENSIRNKTFYQDHEKQIEKILSEHIKQLDDSLSMLPKEMRAFLNFYEKKSIKDNILQ